jgi:hypothetical protein
MRGKLEYLGKIIHYFPQSERERERGEDEK